jgi:hypothetical protein
MKKIIAAPTQKTQLPPDELLAQLLEIIGTLASIEISVRQIALFGSNASTLAEGMLPKIGDVDILIATTTPPKQLAEMLMTSENNAKYLLFGINCKWQMRGITYDVTYLDSRITSLKNYWMAYTVQFARAYTVDGKWLNLSTSELTHISQQEESYQNLHAFFEELTPYSIFPSIPEEQLSDWIRCCDKLGASFHPCPINVGHSVPRWLAMATYEDKHPLTQAMYTEIWKYIQGLTHRPDHHKTAEIIHQKAIDVLKTSDPIILKKYVRTLFGFAHDVRNKDELNDPNFNGLMMACFNKFKLTKEEIEEARDVFNKSTPLDFHGRLCWIIAVIIKMPFENKNTQRDIIKTIISGHNGIEKWKQEEKKEYPKEDKARMIGEVTILVILGDVRGVEKMIKTLQLGWDPESNLFKTVFAMSSDEPQTREAIKSALLCQTLPTLPSTTLPPRTYPEIARWRGVPLELAKAIMNKDPKKLLEIVIKNKWEFLPQDHTSETLLKISKEYDPDNEYERALKSYSPLGVTLYLQTDTTRCIEYLDRIKIRHSVDWTPLLTTLLDSNPPKQIYEWIETNCKHFMPKIEAELASRIIKKLDELNEPTELPEDKVQQAQQAVDPGRAATPPIRILRRGEPLPTDQTVLSDDTDLHEFPPLLKEARLTEPVPPRSKGDDHGDDHGKRRGRKKWVPFNIK